MSAIKFFIYFGSDDAINLDTGNGRRAREEQIYFTTRREAERAIAHLPAKQRRIASVETAEF